MTEHVENLTNEQRAEVFNLQLYKLMTEEEAIKKVIEDSKKEAKK